MARIPFSGLDGQAAAGTIGVGVPDAYQRITADPAAFGAAEAGGLAKLGAAMEQAGGVGLVAATRQEIYENRGAVTNAMNEAQKTTLAVQYGDPDDPDAGPGFYGLKGSQATNAYRGAVDRVRQSFDDVRAGLANDRQREDFDRESRGLQNTTLATMARHNSDQQIAFAKDAQAAGVTQNLQAAGSGYTSDAAFGQGLEGALRSQAELDAMNGAAPEVAAVNAAKVRSDAWTQRITRTAADDPLAAKRMLDGNLGSLTPQAQTYLIDHLTPLVDKRNADDILGAITGQGNGARGVPGSGTIAAPRVASSAALATVQDPQARTLIVQAADKVGLPEAARAAWIAGLHNESGGSPRLNLQNGAAGEIGPGQIMPATGAGMGYTPQQLRDPATNLEASAKYFKQQWDRSGGDATGALRGYNGGNPGNMKAQPYAAAAVGRMNAWGGTPAGGPPAVGTPAPYAIPSKDDMLARADAATAGMPLAVQDRVRSGALAFVSQQEARLHGDRTGFQKDFGNTMAALADGRDVTPLPETRIRSLYPPEQAEPLIEQQRIAQGTGEVTKALAYASPADIASMRQDINSGVGPISRVLAGRGGKTGAVDPSMPADEGADSAATYKLRRQQAAIFEERVAARQRMLEQDPAAYVAQSGVIAPAVLAAQAPTATPEQRAAGVQAVMAEQERLGVPEDKRRALPAGQAQAIVQTLTHTDPAKADMGVALNQQTAAYGDAWPQVFGSLVRSGLPAGYQALAIMDRPDQTAGRADMQRALAVTAEKGGTAKLREAIGDTAKVKEIDAGLGDKMAEFRASAANDRRSVDLIDTMTDSVRALAYYRAMRGDADPLGSAYDDVIGKRYDFDGTMRVPKGQLSDARQATREMVRGLTAAGMPVLAGGAPGMTDVQKQGALLSSVQSRGQWVPTADDGGLQLMVRSRDNVPLTVTRRDGSPLVVRFDRMKSYGPAPERDLAGAATATLGGGY